MNLGKERDNALGQARGYARMGNRPMAQHFIDHAAGFAHVSERQIKNIQKLLDAARAQMAQERGYVEPPPYGTAAILALCGGNVEEARRYVEYGRSKARKGHPYTMRARNADGTAGAVLAIFDFDGDFLWIKEANNP